MFLLGMAALSVFLYRVLNLDKGTMSFWLATKQGTLMDRVKYLVYYVLVGIPVVLAVVAMFGYYYTALRLSGCFFRTLLVLFWALVFESLALEWIVMVQRRLTLIDARRRYAALSAEEKENAGGAQTTDEPIDITAISGQVRRLVSLLLVTSVLAVLYTIWVDVLPALHVFDRVELWQHMATVSESVSGPDGSTRTQTVEKLVPVTLASLLWVVIALGLTVSAVRNIPGLVELMVLQRLPLDSGLRYALTTVIRYLIVLVGAVIVFAMLGVGWSNLQWLAAAVSVGLGFGLQEIFANFVSGLIILFERPLRVGDTVTVDGTNGTVTQIRIRATTIRGWDGRDLIVPNKSIITGTLLNWTLSDSLTRLEFLVGPEYGSDPVKVRQTLLEVAVAHPRVMEEPEPIVIFTGFGASSLDFKLMLFVPTMADRALTITEINTEINRRFAEEGIPIAFPTRTVHFAGVPPSAPAPAGGDDAKGHDNPRTVTEEGGVGDA